MKKMSIFLSLILFISVLHSQVINIPADFPTIQEGIDAANDNDIVLVQPGIYYESIIIDKDITLASLYLTSGDTTYMSQTIIDSGNVKINEYPDSTRLSCSIIGFTVTNGYGVWSQNADLHMECVTICENFGIAGALSIWNCDFNLNNVKIINNSGIIPGGVYMQNSDGELNYCQISNNFAPYGGGGISCYESDPIFSNVIISNNGVSDSITYNGGGVYCQYSSPVFINTLFYNNAAEDGSVLYCIDDSHPLIINSVITGNYQEAPNFYGNGGLALIFAEDNCSVNMQNTIVYANDTLWYGYPGAIFEGNIIANYSNIQKGSGGVYPGENNINEDPLFVGSGEHPYQLSAGSPCIDAGSHYSLDTIDFPSYDLIGNLRFWDGNFDEDTIIDMGAYEYGSIGVGMDNQWVKNEELEVNCYPNPFTEWINIDFPEKETKEGFSMRLFNSNGQEVLCHHVPDGTNKLTLYTAGLKSGLFVLQIWQGNQVITKKLIKR